MQRDVAAAITRSLRSVQARRVLLAGGLGLVAALAACVHLVDPRTAANTDIGLQVWVTVTPVQFSIADTASSIRIRVSAKNPGLDTILVDNGGPTCDKQPDPLAGRGLDYSMRIADDTHELDGGPGGDHCGITTLLFPPKKQRSWDFFVNAKSWKASGRPMVAQQYRARSFFAGYEGYSALFKLVP